jgi:hypothetical protein
MVSIRGVLAKSLVPLKRSLDKPAPALLIGIQTNLIVKSSRALSLRGESGVRGSSVSPLMTFGTGRPYDSDALFQRYRWQVEGRQRVRFVGLIAHDQEPRSALLSVVPCAPLPYPSSCRLPASLRACSQARPREPGERSARRSAETALGLPLLGLIALAV